MDFCKLYESTANYQRIIGSDVTDNSLKIRCGFIQRIKGSVNRHLVNFVFVLL